MIKMKVADEYQFNLFFRNIGKGISTSQMPLLMQVNMFLPLIEKIFALHEVLMLHQYFNQIINHSKVAKQLGLSLL
jgi:hypothetical protein